MLKLDILVNQLGLLVIEMFSDSVKEWLSVTKTTVGFVLAVNIEHFHILMPLKSF